jgi:hypothetical protein
MWWRGGCWGILALLCVSLSGCGGTKLVAVDAVVTLDGKPLPLATVLFVPQEGSRGRPAHGMTDIDGSLQLTTPPEENDGALPGEYRVVVTKSEWMSEPPQGDRSSDDRARKHQERSEARAGKAPLLPAVYANQATTPLRCTVPAGRKVILELRSKAER